MFRPAWHVPPRVPPGRRDPRALTVRAASWPPRSPRPPRAPLAAPPAARGLAGEEAAGGPGRQRRLEPAGHRGRPRAHHDGRRDGRTAGAGGGPRERRKRLPGQLRGVPRGRESSVVAEKTLRKAAIEQYLTGGYNAAAIKTQVTNGKGSMPAFGDKLGPDDIDDVAAYVLDQSTKW
ncbi:unnamed protein product [Prorocentrum cordatum]|uniref:Cytochrome c domain-containing protein n=1 Tax=Prorocentrum cordatum TaxID=2364126 RepID=A0ABN9VHR9_9DINO|nr:unnamed protein product [Polarella glacialis]